MGGKRTGRCSFLRRLMGLVSGESFDPEYRIKFLDEVGRLENLDQQDRKMFKRGDLISAYRDKTQELKKMQTKLSAIQHSLLVLKEEYDTIQASCDLCLSDDLDDLVETVINAYENKFGDGPSSADNVIDMLADIMEFSQAFTFTSPNLIPPQLTKEFKGGRRGDIYGKE
ncbi:hypothetical protein NP493_179g01033 [Ridgeia piscesae]|uniref:Uncharacterized protein n=1 Tax=Ridgeia piscesae TaxID=27915 RepID=A0AAD9UF79_RIDPI|nr:hypothetical protein NP493_179g01033 [Ridgeia piscesae]